MLLLVAIFVGVVVVFLRQNNKCVMDEDEVIEGYSSPNSLGFSNPIWRKDFSKLRADDKAYYDNFTYTHKRKNSRHPDSKFQVRKRAMTDCNAMDSCIGLEVDRSGTREIKLVLLRNIENIGQLDGGHLSDSSNKNVLLKQSAWKDNTTVDGNPVF